MTFSRSVPSALVLLIALGCGERIASDVDSGIDAGGGDAGGAMDAMAAIDAPVGDGSSAPVDAPAAIDAPTLDDRGCMPITSDASAIGDTCSTASECPSGYACQGFSGIVFRQSCQILCARDCDCPQDHQCVEVSDKSGMPWMQCAPI